MNLLDNFQRYIRRNELAAPEDFILLTVSGGVDSMVMLSLFVRSGYRVGVAHCNFQLRGVESEEDEELVRREAEKYGVPWYNKRFDTKGEMERTGESMEMAARRLRYAWFDELSREHGYTVVAIAHHIDDSIETFFINLLRGTGLRGLTGITTHAGKLIRPLMFASRKDILEYAVAQHIPYREDSSNRSTKYLRNKIRLGLVPRIKEISPKFTDLMRQNIGRLTDAQGRVVSFENTVIVMTSNAGSQSNNTPAGFGRTVSQMSKDRVMKALEEIMRPEFLNRIDEIIAFNQLTEDNFRHIAEIMLGELRTTLADKDIRLTWDDSLLGLLTEKSYSVKYGARNLRRLIEKEIENPLATAIVTGDKPLMGAHLSAEDGKVKLDTI